MFKLYKRLSGVTSYFNLSPPFDTHNLRFNIYFL